jgi:hypothetical protein
MGRGAVKRLVPAGKRAPKAGARPVTSLKLARKITSAYHSLLYARARARGDAPRLAALAGELAALGGLETYQAASALSTSAFRSSRWIFKQLTAHGLQPARGALPLRVLELGATNAQLAVCPWLRVRAIDLMSRDPAVEAKDFFDVPVGSGPTGAPSDVAPAAAPAAPAGAGAAGAAAAAKDRVWGASPSRLRPCAAWGVEAGAYLPPRALPGVGAVAQLQRRAGARAPTTGCYDIVVNNLVLNCVAEPQARVRMLVACRDHLVPGGLLFFALPSRCLDASAFLARKTVEGLLAALGLAQRAYRQTPKISFYLFQRVDVLPAAHLAAAAPAPAPAPAPEAPPPEARPLPSHGAGWRPVITAADAAEEAWLRRALQHPPVQRSAGAAGLTEFSLSVEPGWVVAAAPAAAAW